MRFLGRLEHREYKDDCEGLDSAIIEQYYGVDESKIDDDDNSDTSHDSADSDSGSDSGLEDLEGEHMNKDIVNIIHAQLDGRTYHYRYSITAAS